MIEIIINLFKPNSFKDNFYGWLSNQVGHVSLSCAIMVLISFTGINAIYSAIALSLFWVLWEIRHLKITGDLKDFMQDLYFELSGVFVFLFPYYLIGVVLVFVLSVLNYAFREWRNL